MASLSILKTTELAEFYFRSKQYQLAKEILIKSISSNEANSKCYELLAYIYGNEGNQKELFRLLSQACSFSNATAEAHYYFGKELIQNNQIEKGIYHLNQAIVIGGPFFEVYFEIGLANTRKKNFIDAEANFINALKFKPDNVESIYNLAKIYSEEFNRHKESLELYDQVLKLNGSHVSSLLGKAYIHENLYEFESAELLYKRVIEISIDSKSAWLALGRVLTKLGRLDEAILNLEKSRENIKASIFHLINGTFFIVKKDFHTALNFFDTALLDDPNNSEIWLGKSIAEYALGFVEKALISIEKSIYQDKQCPNAWMHRGNFYLDIQNYEMALQSYRMALDLDETIPLLVNNYINAKLKSMNWGDIDDFYEKIKANPAQYLDPLTILYICDQPEVIYHNNQKYNNSIYRKISQFNAEHKIKTSSKIKLAYVSADFREHAVSFLMNDVFKHHNREKFEIIGIFINNKDADNLTQEMQKLFDSFIDITELSDAEAIQLIRNLNIDIALDLTGHTRNARTNLFLNRIARIQINYIGYPHTMGSSNYDYIIADNHLVTHDYSKYYSEKIIFLPNCFQPNSIRNYNNSFQELKVLNLPLNTFIYCCFNFNSKISKKMLYLWIEILKETNNSVLWIYIEKNAQTNFIREVNQIDSHIIGRIIFAERSNYSEYLNRFKFANLFLDTYPYGGGTTTSDALLSGLPVLTMAGCSFHNRMSLSLLLNLQLSELVTDSFDAYKSTAIHFCNDASAYQLLKCKLEKSLSTSTIFDPVHYTGKLESALIEITEKSF